MGSVYSHQKWVCAARGLWWRRWRWWLTGKPWRGHRRGGQKPQILSVILHPPVSLFSYTSWLAIRHALDMYECVLDVSRQIIMFLFLFLQSISSLKEVIGQLLDAVLTCTEHGRLISELFQRLPSKVVVLSISFQHIHKHIILLLLFI